MHARLYACMHTSMYVCMHVCMYACIYVYRFSTQIFHTDFPHTHVTHSTHIFHIPHKIRFSTHIGKNFHTELTFHTDFPHCVEYLCGMLKICVGSFICVEYFPHSDALGIIQNPGRVIKSGLDPKTRVTF